MAGPENGESPTPAADEAPKEIPQEEVVEHPKTNGITPVNGVPDVSRKVATGRAMRPEGQRNLQDSTFSISQELDAAAPRPSIRIRAPPGGQSSGGFW